MPDHQTSSLVVGPRQASRSLPRFPEGYRCEQGVWTSPGRDGPLDFTYSDGGDVESRLYAAVKAASDKSLFSHELVGAIRDWPSRYHLSPQRANLLRPLAGVLKGRVLELGAGCGAVTRYLGEIGADVVAVEGSHRRACVAAARTSDLANVKVVCSRIEDFAAEAPFDVVTLIGVLEYARAFARFEDAHERRLLEHAAAQLAPNGLLIVAIENKFGLKYLAGAPEDHYEAPYFGINDSYTETSVVTFGFVELKELFNSVGLDHQALLLPLPDYKLPTSVLSAEGADGSGGRFDAAPLIAYSVVADRQRPAAPPFSLERAWETAFRNRLVKDLANSFLLVGGRSADAVARAAAEGALAWHYSAERHPAFAREARFEAQGDRVRVRRARLSDASPINLPVENDAADEDYIQGRHWGLELARILNRPGWSIGDIGAWARPWIDLLVSESGVGSLDNASFRTFVDGRWFDATPFNAIRDETGRLRFFDQEWRVRSTLEFGFIVYRGLRDSIAKVTSYAEPAAGVPLNVNRLVMAVLADLGILVARGDIERFAALEMRIQNWVQGRVDEALKDAIDEEFWVFPLNVRRPVREGLVRENNALREALDEQRGAMQAEHTALQKRIDGLRSDLAAARQAHERLQALIRQREEEVAGLRRERQLFQASSLGQMVQGLQHVEARRPTLAAATSFAFRALRRVRRSVRKALGRRRAQERAARQQMSRLFDAQWYQSTYPDVAKAGIGPLEHYLTIGASEGRDPSPAFDTDWYLARYPDVAQAGINPLEHYVTAGAREGRDPSPDFDTDWYLARYPDVAEAGINPLEHYLAVGVKEGRAPKPKRP